MRFKDEMYLKAFPRENVEKIKQIEKIKEESAVSLTDEEVEEIEKNEVIDEEKTEVSSDGIV